ncbi:MULTISPECIES: 6-phosphogluconolactonase [unclassified Pseudofrankia]|uniref:6-phosphogluconolactonase n=1 Tax=unclassified Pseudofrankia TaxID=2994372 RepID=UPI0008D95B4E|nr:MULTISPECIES: 6-phosphogluconolactonase [unclassified Pseudofrankia]MDT3438389.1 6-phosphogluconolactonase [Pseudofrankia sp. BMG5.37]OHV67836.1 6-phosphogluconolactonase [Pseudofrankia sp. BMG5.36]
MELIVHPDAGLLAKAAAARLVTALVDAQAQRGEASLVLTGGGIGIALLRALRTIPALDAVNWSKVDVWWGDERFVPADSPDRNSRQAREALLDHVPVDEKRVFEVGALTSAGGSVGAAGGYVEPEQAAADYAAALAARAPAGAAVPAFDVLLLGIGPEGHIASIFPHSPAAAAAEPVVAIRESPKPPPNRISFTFPTIRAARQVWVIAAGEEKADAVATAVAGADALDLPAAGARGLERTLWLVDRAAASRAGLAG